MFVGTKGDRAYFATADHLIRNAKGTVAQEISISLAWQRDKNFPARLDVHGTEQLDLAFISIYDPSQAVAKSVDADFLAEASKSLERDDEVRALGNPLGRGWRLSAASPVISVEDGQIGFTVWVIPQGFSGGALVGSDDKRVLGLVIAHDPPDGIAIPIREVLSQAEAQGIDVVEQHSGAPANSDTVRLVLDSVPPGAALWLDGRPLGDAPQTVNVPRGSTLDVRADAGDSYGDFVLQSDQYEGQTVRLQLDSSPSDRERPEGDPRKELDWTFNSSSDIYYLENPPGYVVRIRLFNPTDYPIDYLIRISGGYYRGCYREEDQFVHEKYGVAEGQLGGGDSEVVEIRVENLTQKTRGFGKKCAGISARHFEALKYPYSNRRDLADVFYRVEWADQP